MDSLITLLIKPYIFSGLKKVVEPETTASLELEFEFEL